MIFIDILTLSTTAFGCMLCGHHMHKIDKRESVVVESKQTQTDPIISVVVVIEHTQTENCRARNLFKKLGIFNKQQ